MWEHIPPEDSLIWRIADTAKLLCTAGVAKVTAHRAAVERARSLEAMMAVVVVIGLLCWKRRGLVVVIDGRVLWAVVMMGEEV